MRSSAASRSCNRPRPASPKLTLRKAPFRHRRGAPLLATMGRWWKIAFILAMVVVVVPGNLTLSSGLPDAVLLTLAGLADAALPGRNLVLAPQFVLNLVIPPLLYSTALNSSVIAIRSRLRQW
jgi:hypothetical protein